MSEPSAVLLYEIFPFCMVCDKLTSDFSLARVVSATVDKSKMSMALTLSLTEPAAPLEISAIEELVALEYGLSSVTATALTRSPAQERSKASSPGGMNGTAGHISGAEPVQKPDEVIMGRRIKAAPSPIGEINLDLGKATVVGEVCEVSSKYIEKRDAWILSFDLTDYTGTIHVSKFMTDENASKIVQKVQKGMWLSVSGNLSISRFDSDLALEPASIVVAERELRLDTAVEKRVELHLHTKMSALDAVTDVAEAIRRAVQWGHPAIAITDHGVVHSFPDAASAVDAANGKIKVIYGIEGYFLNDIDSSTAVFGYDMAADAPLTGQCSSGAPGSAAGGGAVPGSSAPGGGVLGSGVPGDGAVSSGLLGSAAGGGAYSRSLADGEFVIFDIETTGLSPSEDAILEIGAIAIKHGQEQGRFHTFADPGRPIPYEITDLTGLKDTDVAGAPSQHDAVTAFLRFAEGRALVAHNADFDVGFIYESCQAHGIPYYPFYIDTLALARTLLPRLKNHKLDTIATHFGYSGFNHHRADDDAAATMHVWIALQKLLSKSGITDIGQVNGFLAKRRDEKQPGSGSKRERARLRHIIILAKNQTGLNNLYKLVTKSHLEFFDRHPVIPKSILIGHREGLIIGSACEAGEVFDAITDRRSSLVLSRLAGFYDYLEIQPICNNLFMLSGDKPRAGNEDELRGFNRKVVELGKLLGKPVVATGDVHFLDPWHEIFRHILLMSKGFENADHDLPVYFRTTGEMLDEFCYLGEETALDVVVRNPRMIADMCEVVSPLPPAKKLFLPTLEGSAGDLKALVSERLSQLYGDNPPEIVTQRVDSELRDILERNYDVIYMAAQKLVADSMKHGYLVGSRGSVGSSLVAFLAGITEVNALPAHYRCPDCRISDFESGAGHACGADMPDKCCPACGRQYVKDGFNIPFETFLGFDGDKVPDIDLNFSGDYQARAHKFTTDLFGADNVFRAGTIGTIKAKTAYGFAKKYLDDTGRAVTKAEENRLARGCEGVKRTTGQHPGGLIIIPQGTEITDYCPAQHPADDSDKGIVTTHFDYHRMEDNLIKIDELGHDDPTMIRMLEDLTGVDARGIKLGDPDTMAIFTSPAPLGLPEDDEIIGATGTIGIPEFGTPLTRQMLCDTKPESFDTLVRLSGFAHGELVWIGNAKNLILSGKATVGDTISCRDDIMLFLISQGMDARYAFRISESVRKGYGLPDGTEAEMVRHRVPGWYIESCKKVKYPFPKAHAVAYVMMAFRIAWFKVHRPIEFYSAYFYRRSQSNGFDAEYMTRGIDVARAKIKELRGNPDIKGKDEELLITLESCYEFYLRGFSFSGIDLYESDPVKFLIVSEKELRPPFVSISGLGETAARDIAENRRSREFISVDELSDACAKVSRTHLDQLRALGALRNLPESSQMSLF